MLLRLSPGTIARGLRDLEFTPGQELYLEYSIELQSTDYPLGTTLIAASLVIAQDFGLNALLSRQITPIGSPAGQITNSGATGVAALYFTISASDLAPYSALGPLAFEIVVTDSRGLQASLDLGALVPTGSTNAKPVDHVTVTPAAFSLAYPNTQPLTVTAFDEDGNELTGRLALWSSSDSGTASVDANGIVSVKDAGSAVITASVEGKTAASATTTTFPPALGDALDWSDLDLTQRRAAFIIRNPATAERGNSTALPFPIGTYYGQGMRTTFPRSRSEWAQVGNSNSYGAPDQVPNVFDGAIVRSGAGPDPDQAAFRWIMNSAEDSTLFWQQSPQFINGGAGGLAGDDTQDVTNKKNYFAFSIQADPSDSAAIGKKIWVDLTNGPPGPFDPYVRRFSIILTAEWQDLAVEVLTLSEWENFWVRLRPASRAEGGNAGTTVKVTIGRNFSHARKPDNARDYMYPLPIHEEFGYLSQFQTRNCWYPSDDPTITGTATKSATTDLAPDSNEYSVAPTLQEYMLPGGAAGSLTTEAYRHVEQFQDSDHSDKACKFVYVGQFIAPIAGIMPADGALSAYLDIEGGPVLGPLPLVRDAAQMRRVDGACFYRTQTPFTPNPSVDDPPSGTGFRSFKPIIRNDTGSAITYRGTRCHMIGTTTRSVGHHHAWVPARAITGPGVNEGLHPSIFEPERFLNTQEGIWIFRGLPFFDLGEVVNRGMLGSPGFWQTGPYGSGFVSFDGSVEDPGSGLPLLTFKMHDDNPGTFNWAFTLNLAMGLFPAWTEFDWVIVWRNWQLYDVALGMGPGIALTWVADRQMVGGNVATYSGEDGTHWNVWDHIQLGGDRDKTRNFGGWIQNVHSELSVDVANYRLQIQALIELGQGWGARQAHT